jgi:hypothetical protein
MSEQPLYIRRTKGDHVMPPITLEEMLALVASKRVDAEDELKVVGVRSFASDETWAPMRDYPEFFEFFDSGRKLAKSEAGKARKSWTYALWSCLGCVAAICFFWWNPYVDTQDAVGEVGRLRQKSEVDRRKAISTEQELQKQVEKLSRLSEELAKKNKSLQAELGTVRQKLEDALRSVEDEAASAASLAKDDSKLRAEVDRLKARVAKLNELPKFWPGAESLQVPESSEEVRLVSVLPDTGWLYVIGTRPFPDDTIVVLDQSGFFGTRIFAKVVKSYANEGGGRGMSLHVPDAQAGDISKIRKLRLGETIKCYVASNK